MPSFLWICGFQKWDCCFVAPLIWFVCAVSYQTLSTLYCFLIAFTKGINKEVQMPPFFISCHDEWKYIWQLKFLQKSPVGDQLTCENKQKKNVKNLSILGWIIELTNRHKLSHNSEIHCTHKCKISSDQFELILLR